MNPGFINLCWGLYNSTEKKYFLGYPSSASTTPDKVIVYDLLVKQYSLWDHIPGGCAVNFQFIGTQDVILLGDPNKGNIYQLLQGYADIYGDSGTATGGSSTTLSDSTKAWGTNAVVDARVLITSGTGAGSIGIVTSNTGTQLTVSSWSGAAPGANSTYIIGYYTSYWKTKPFDFEMIGYTKKYRFFNLFADAKNYPIQFGSSIDFQPLTFQKPFNLSSGALTWDPANLVWGSSTGNWGSYSSEFAQANVGATGRYCQFIFGNNQPNQPWRALKYSISYKLKKERPNIVTT